MKILTKEWALKHEQVKLIHNLKVYNEQKETYDSLKTKSWNLYCQFIKEDEELAKLVLNTKETDKLYTAQLDNNKKIITSLPQTIYSKLKDIDSLVLGYANNEDKELLSSYANELLIEVESKVNKANNITEIAEDCLPNEFVLDNFVGELVYKEYSKSKDYFIEIGESTVCIENYEIIERENFIINKWEEDNPLTLWTALYSAELECVSNNCYELRLLLVDGDKYASVNYWYFTLRGTIVKEC